MMENNPILKIEETADGSRTLYLPGMDEHYHSIKGARTESAHIFIGLGLNHCPRQSLNVLEIGFGTGLNAFLTLKEAGATGRRIRYTGIEINPLPADVTVALAYTDDPLFDALHRTPWNEATDLTPFFRLVKIAGDFTSYRFADRYDVIYFDAFAPEKQPEMWNRELFEYLYVITNNGGILTTYCAKGEVRRRLQAAGFTVERLPGPPGGKREVLRATKK